jgi:hypothetical protein
MKTMTVTKVLQKGIYLVKLNYCQIKAENDNSYVLKK